MIQVLRMIVAMLTRRERRLGLALFGLTLVTGIMETAGVASIMPFLSVLSNPEMVSSNPYLEQAYEFFGFTERHNFLIFLGTCTFFVVVVGLALKGLTQWSLLQFAHKRKFGLSTRLFKGYLTQPYTWFLGRNSADLGKTALQETEIVADQVLRPLVEMVANAVLVLCLGAFLVSTQPWGALGAATLLGGGYTLIYLVLRRYLGRIGKVRLDANEARFRIVQEAFGGIKEVKAGQLEPAYARAFRGPAWHFADSSATGQALGQVPRFALEALAVGGLILFVLIVLGTGTGELSQVITSVGVLAFAGLRMLPALQKVYHKATQMRFGTAALGALYEDMAKVGALEMDVADVAEGAPPTPLPLERELSLDHVTFTYPQKDEPAVADLSLTVPAHTTVGLVGATGAGKSTVVDLILGLLRPQAGAIRVDGWDLTDARLGAWQRSVGYVSQHIFLADDSVAGNIAFGVPAEAIDRAAVERAARIANLHEFVMTELEHGYDTPVGERGVRLSGGQRQRIGIARALYPDPDVLILDEATSALDNRTEQAVMAAVHNLGRSKTIILIAHRLSTVQPCDTVHLLERGQVIASGSYDELLASSQAFNRLAQTGT